MLNYTRLNTDDDDDQFRLKKIKMKDCSETKAQKKSAKFVSTFIFLFGYTVSAAIFFAQEILDVFDYLLMLLAPLALSIFSYFVVLHHDPNASD